MGALAMPIVASFALSLTGLSIGIPLGTAIAAGFLLGRRALGGMR